MDQKRLEREREALIGQITDAFRSVGRAGGVSWHAAGQETVRFRTLHTEAPWIKLLDPKRWDTAPGSQWSFLDPIGFRYYLAPGMIRSLRGDENIDLRYHLSLSPGLQNYYLHMWSLLDRKQKLVIGRYLRYMHEAEKQKWPDHVDPMGWDEVYDSYWRAECEGGAERTPKRKKRIPP